MNTKFKVIFIFALFGIVIANFILQHSSALILMFNMRRNVNIRVSEYDSNNNNNKKLVQKQIDAEKEAERRLSRIKIMYAALEGSESKVFSQNGEDGVLEKLIDLLKFPAKGFYVECGVGDGHESNTRILREFHSWKGVMFDSSNRNSKVID